ncbi:MAG: AAA-like domain-containing protein, partial [bacterium]
MAKSAYTVGGNLRPGDPFYIHRQADEDLLNLCRAGEFAYILSSRQVGKSSLMESTAQQLNAEGICTAKVDLNRLGVKTTAEKWYSGLLFEIQKELALRTKVFEWWEANARLSFAQRFIKFFEEVLLVEVDSPVVIFIDEIDTTLGLDFTDDFFAAIRNIYNSRGDVPAFRRLSFVFIGVATPSDLIKDASRTPFNIGRRVDITDFTYDEALPLADGLGLPDDEAQEVLQWGIKWTGGHPYLTQRMCSVIAEQERNGWTEAGVDEAVAKTFFGRMSDEEHLKFVQKRMTRPDNGPERVQRLLITYRDILVGKAVPDEEQSVVKSELKLTGIVRRQNGHLAVRNPIYAQVFDRKWIDAHWPVKYWTPTVQRAALATIIVLFLALFGLAIFAWQQAKARVEQEQKGRVVADSLKLQAFAARDTANIQRQMAVVQRQLAVATAGKLQVALTRTDSLLGVTEQQKRISDSLRAVAEAARDSVNRFTRGYVARTLATQAPLLQQVGDDTIGALLARQAYLFNARGPGLFQDEIYNALRKALNAPSFRRSKPQGGPDTLVGHTGWVMAMAITPNSQKLISGGADSTVRVWDLREKKLKMTFPRHHTGTVRALTLDADGSRLATGCDDYLIRLWDMHNLSAKPKKLKGHTGWIWSVAFSPDGKTLVSCSGDSTLRLWDLQDNKLLETLAEHRASVRAVAFSPRDPILASCGADSTIRLWNWRRLDAGSIRRLKHATQVRTLAFNAKGNLLAAGCENGSVWLWDLDALEQKPRPLLSHETRVNSVAFNPQGDMLATAGEDWSIRLWDLENPQRSPIILREHDNWIYAVVFAPDGKSVISASSDKTIRLWVARTYILAERVCQSVRRNLTRREWREFLPNYPYEYTCAGLPEGVETPLRVTDA